MSMACILSCLPRLRQRRGRIAIPVYSPFFALWAGAEDAPPLRPGCGRIRQTLYGCGPRERQHGSCRPMRCRRSRHRLTGRALDESRGISLPPRRQGFCMPCARLEARFFVDPGLTFAARWCPVRAECGEFRANRKQSRCGKRVQRFFDSVGSRQPAAWITR